MAEKAGNLHRRSVYGPPGHKISRVVKRNKEAHTHAFVRHRVKDAVGSGHDKAIDDHRPPLFRILLHMVGETNMTTIALTNRAKTRDW